MNSSPESSDRLNDEAFAPLKRNHACLECKKRKIRCDATHPACGPCMRSHAHSARLAQKSNASIPPLVCTWVDGEGPEPSGREETKRIADVAPERKRSGESSKIKVPVKGRTLEREKEIRRDEERDILLARIADLESRLAGLSPSDGNDSSSRHSHPSGSHSASTAFTSLDNSPNVLPSAIKDWPTGSPASMPGMEGGVRQAWVEDVADINRSNNQSLPGSSSGFDINGLFMVPANWPLNLPSPFLLEHLVETFFNHAPQMPRMIHRPSFMTRLKLPPTHDDFPHPCLLHAMCAAAAPFTAWVNSLPPEALEECVERHKRMYATIEGVEDFGLAQAEAGQKSIRMSTQACKMAHGNMPVEICQASIILADLYFTKGMPMQGWIIAGTPPRLLKALEFMNKNMKRPNRTKEPLAAEPSGAIQREERLATVWMAFIMDAGYALNSYWSGSLELDELLCTLPVSAEAFNSLDDSMPPNPQTAQSPDLLTNHPVPDSFLLVAKATTLVSRIAKWLRVWTQRDIVPGDQDDGMRSPEFAALMNDIYAFQASVPNAMQSIFKVLDSTSATAFDANILLVHILPNIAICMLHEPFVDWQSPHETHAMSQIQRGYEAILGILHLIPSNLDVSLVTTSLLVFCLQTTGRLIIQYIHRSAVSMQFGLAARQQVDLQTVQAVLKRYGQKHMLGQMMSAVLDAQLAMTLAGKTVSARQLCVVNVNSSENSPSSQSATSPHTVEPALDPSQFTPSWSSTRPAGPVGFNQRDSFTGHSSSSGPSPTVNATITPPGQGWASNSNDNSSGFGPSIDMINFANPGMFDTTTDGNCAEYPMDGFVNPAMTDIDSIMMKGGLFPTGATLAPGYDDRDSSKQQQSGQMSEMLARGAAVSIDGKDIVWGA